MKSVIATLLSAVLITACQSEMTEPSSEVKTTLDRVTEELCDKRVILLGENGSHADGAALTFKSALVQQLIEKCGVQHIAFEASFYDFEDVNFMVEDGSEVTDKRIYSALGRLHNRNAEITSLVEALVPAINERRVRLYGIDNQLSSQDTTYTLYTMPGDLAAFLPSPRAGECEAIIKSRTTWQFLDNRPYDANYRAQINSCIDEIDVAIKSGSSDTPRRDTYLAMIENIKRALHNDFNDYKLGGSHRDRSMYLNLKSILKSNPAQNVVVWSFNTHVAKSEAGMGLYEKGPNMGRLLFDDYDDTIFSLGFSALSGETRLINGEVETISEKREGALERQAYIGQDTPEIYISHDDLKAFQTVPGGLYSHKSDVLDWSKSFDGIVVIKNERAAERAGRRF